MTAHNTPSTSASLKVTAQPYMMTQTMRWFGPKDPVSLSDIRQAGATGVVTALHHIPNGGIWTVEEITKRKLEVEAAGMEWTTVESLPVSEGIKTQAPGFEALIENYKTSLINLAACGLKIITYNFMPLLDWTRTDLSFEMPDGARALKFELDAVAAYDIYILKRPGAEASYSADLCKRASLRFAAMDEAARTLLERNIIKGLPGSEESFTSADFLKAINVYADIDEARLKDNMVYFLKAVCPLADELGLNLVCHPDDPPYTMFGLPRIVSTQADLEELFTRVPNPSNGLCFCAGSLALRPGSDIVAMIEQFGERIHFVHLRNTTLEENGDFYEDTHLQGDVDMYAQLKALHKVCQTYKRYMVMRPDHGHQMLDDLSKKTNPGYSAIGRLRGLAELRGLELGIARSQLER